MTIVSIHEKNRWPRTGNLEDCNISNIMNIPVPENLNDNEMTYIIDNLVLVYGKNLNPDLVIIQAGSDCLEHDPQSKMILSNYFTGKNFKIKKLPTKHLY